MHRATLVLNRSEPQPLSLRQPFGVDLDVTLWLKDQGGEPVDPTPMLPQFALLPRSRGGLYGYDMTITDAANGGCSVHVPGTAMMDPRGYSVEVYQRRENAVAGDPALPVALIAKGNVVMEGSAYTRYGPLGVISVPVVTGPPGPQGAQGLQGQPGLPGDPGDPGQRGTVWTTGPSTPILLGGEIEGDMYLNESNGDVWRFDASVGSWVRR